MKRALLLAVVLLLLAAPLVVAFRDLGRLLSTELMRLAWMVRLFLEGLPQLALWLGLLVLVLVSAVSSLFGRPRPLSGQESALPAEAPGQVWELSRWIRRATLGEYSRWTLHRYLEGLVWGAMAARQGASVGELKRRFRAGELTVDPEIAAFLEIAARRRFRPAAQPWAWLHRLMRREASTRAAVPRLERIVEFMEEQLAPGPAPHISLQPEAKHEPDAD